MRAKVMRQSKRERVTEFSGFAGIALHIALWKSVARLVAAGEIYLVEHFAAVKPSFQKIHQESCFAMPQAVAYGAGVRRDEEIRSSPEGAFGGSGSTEVTSSAAPLRTPFSRAWISADSSRSEPRPTLIKRAPGFMRAICAAPIRWRVSDGFWRGDDHVVGVWQSFFELRDGDDFFSVGGVALAGARYAPDAHVKGTGALGEFAADGAEIPR